VRFPLRSGLGLGLSLGLGLGLGLGPYDPLNPLHGGVSALDAAGVLVVGGAEGTG
jgi:hypothetical protein